jgi:O-acetyl-ADP-ribose deacetylase (regulator of RNase III)
MTIHLTKGNIFESDVQVLVNPVNCVGTMGKGLAKEFKKHYPKVFTEYKRRCKEGTVDLGMLDVHFIGQYSNSWPEYVVNFPTKDHWKNKSDLFMITKGLLALDDFLFMNEIESVAIPALGCGLGGLKWEDVQEQMYYVLNNLPLCEIYIYEPLEL